MADIQAKFNRVRDAANDIAETATEKLKDGTARAREGAGGLIQSSRDKAGEATDRAVAVYGEARDRTQRVATRANEIVQEHPIAATAAAVAAGAVIAWMFPKSRKLMKTLPGIASAVGTRAIEAAMAARAAAEDGADVAKVKAGDAIAAARDGTSSIRKADLTSKASHLAESAITLVTEKASNALSAARSGATSAKDSALGSDFTAKASHLADEAIGLVAEKAAAFSDALKNRLPKN